MLSPSGPAEHRPAQRVWTQDQSDGVAADCGHFVPVGQHLHLHVRPHCAGQGSSGPPGPWFIVCVGLCRFGFTVLLFLLRSVVSMNFNVVYIYTAEVSPPLTVCGSG